MDRALNPMHIRASSQDIRADVEVRPAEFVYVPNCSTRGVLRRRQAYLRELRCGCRS